MKTEKTPQNFTEFEETLDATSPPKSWNVALKSLWYDAKGDWETAHDLVDGTPGTLAKCVHAYLHRKEGDDWNASYWYQNAGKPFCELSLEAEAKQLVEKILK